VHRFRYGSEIEVVVAACRDRRADENSVYEKGGRNLLEPEPGAANDAGGDIGTNRHRKTKQRKAADDHQDQFKRVERPPFKVALALQDQFVGNAHHAYPSIWRGRRAGLSIFDPIVDSY
jgi:hypothetical protein